MLKSAERGRQRRPLRGTGIALAMAKVLMKYLVPSIKSMRGGKILEIFAILKN